MPKPSDYQSFKRPADLMGRPRLLPTSKDIEGPFYKAGAPDITDGILARPGKGDSAFVLSGQVLDTDGVPIPYAMLDVWQADSAGNYDNAGYRLRGQFVTDAEGRYRVETIRPGNYDISEPGDPEPHEHRCAHIHVKLKVAGYPHLTTQLYFAGDEYNATDHWFSSARQIRHDGSDWTTGTFDFVLERE